LNIYYIILEISNKKQIKEERVTRECSVRPTGKKSKPCHEKQTGTTRGCIDGSSR
jgi:hypothetical protein